MRGGGGRGSYLAVSLSPARAASSAALYAWQMTPSLT